MNQDDVDTAPVIAKEDGNVEFNSASIPPGTSAVVTLRATETMRSPTLFASSNPRDDRVVVAEVLCDATALVPDPVTVESLRFGRKLNVTLAEGAVISVKVRNDSDSDASVGVSLVSAELVDER